MFSVYPWLGRCLVERWSSTEVNGLILRCFAHAVQSAVQGGVRHGCEACLGVAESCLETVNKDVGILFSQ